MFSGMSRQDFYDNMWLVSNPVEIWVLKSGKLHK